MFLECTYIWSARCTYLLSYNTGPYAVAYVSKKEKGELAPPPFSNHSPYAASPHSRCGLFSPSMCGGAVHPSPRRQLSSRAKKGVGEEEWSEMAYLPPRGLPAARLCSAPLLCRAHLYLYPSSRGRAAPVALDQRSHAAPRPQPLPDNRRLEGFPRQPPLSLAPPPCLPLPRHGHSPRPPCRRRRERRPPCPKP